MKQSTKIAGIRAFFWSGGFSSLWVLWPIFISFASGVEISEEDLALKLVAAIFIFPIAFAALWVWGALSKADPVTGGAITPEIEKHITPDKTTVSNIPEKPLSKWNYIWATIGLFMLLFLFVPQLVSGELPNQSFIGAAFWVGVIAYCLTNILSRNKSSSGDNA